MHTCGHCKRTFFEEGDKVLLNASGHGKATNEEIDARNQRLAFAICTVTQVAGDQVTILSENCETDTVPQSWLTSAFGHQVAEVALQPMTSKQQ